MFFRPRRQPDPRSRRRRSLLPRLEALEIRLAPAATQLVFTSQPATVVAGHSFGLTVSAEDASGNVDTTFNSDVSVSWQSDPFDSSTVAAVDGVATFSGLTLTTAGAQYPQATGGGLTSTLTNSIAVTAATATQLVVISPPPAAVTAGGAFGLVIAAEDQYGNVDPSLTGSVTVALASNPGGSTLTGTTNVNFSNGLAAFSGLSLDEAGSGYAPVASSEGLAPPPWITFDVSAAAATQLVVTSPPPGTVVAGGAFGFVIAASDPYGNVDPAFTGAVTVALAGNPGGSTLTGTDNVNFSNGLAIFAGLSLNKTGDGYTLQVSSNGLAPPSSSLTVNVSAGTASQLAVIIQPPATVTAGQIFPSPVTVAVEDALGNTVTSFSGNLAVAPTNVAVEGSLGGTLTVPVVAGTASFTDVNLDKAGTGYTLQVSGTGLSTVTTSPFSVLAGPAAELVVTAQPPASVAAGSAFGLVVQVGDQYGNAIPSYTGGGSVTVALAGPPPGVALGGGTTTLSFSAGLATFAGLTLNTAGSGYSLEVSFQPGPSDDPLASATSSALTVTAAAATRLVVTSPPPAVVTAGAGFGLVIAAEDPFGNVVPTVASNVTVALAGNPGGGALGGTPNASFSNGLATFAGLTLDTADSGYTLQLSSSGLTPPAPIAVDVTAAAATQLVVTAQPPAAIAAGVPFGLTVAVEDAFGNAVTGYQGNLAIAPASGLTGVSLLGALTVAVTGGQGVFGGSTVADGLSLDKAGTGYTLQVSGTGLPAVTTSPFSVTATAPSQLVVTTPPPASVAAGSPFGLEVSAEDQYGNVDSALAGSVTVNLVNNPGGSTLGGTTTVSFSNGVATFAGLTLSQPGVGYTLQAASSGLASPTPIAMNVTAPVAAQLVVTAQPPTYVAAGDTFGLTVVVEDANGNPVTGFIGNLSVSPSNSAVEGSLGGTLTVPVIDAVATFTGLSLDKAGDGLTLQVSVGGLLTVTTNPFSVTVGPTAQLAVTVQPPASVAAGSGFGLQASAEDQYGNVVPTYDGRVTVALADNPTGGALGGTTTATFSNGTATFAGLSLTRAGTGYTLEVSGGGLISPASSVLTVTAAAATQLFVVSRPPAAVVAGSTFGLQISAQDPFGNVNSSVNGSVTVALADDPGGGALGGTTSVSFSNGLATFALTLDTAAIGDTLQAASSGLAPPAPIPLNVTPAAVSQLVVISQPPATILAGQGFGLTVAVEDAFGNTVTGFNGNLAIAPASTVTGTLGGVVTAPATAGLATFTGLTITTPGSALTLQVSGTGLSAVTTSPFSVTAAPAVQLVVTSQPPADVTAGSGFGLQISAEDSSGNVDPTFHGNVTVALASNLGGSSLGGTVTVAAVNGVATFAGLILSTASAGYALQATSGGLTPATTGLIDALTPGSTAPTSGASGTVGYLAIHSQPTVVDAGTYFQLTVVVDNAQGATDTSFSGMVTLALASNPGGATLGGNLTMPVSDGLLTYYGLTLNVAGSGYTIRVTGNGLALAVSSPIIVVNPPVRLVAITPPPASVAANGSFGLAVAVVDASGNLAPGYNGPVTITLAGKHSKAKLRGTLTVAAVNGVATFSGLTLINARKGQALQVQATAGGLTSVTTNPFSVMPAPARIRPHPARDKRVRLIGRDR